MALTFNVTADDRFYLGEDKFLEFKVYEADGATPLDATGLALEWSLKKKAKDPDPPLIGKSVGSGITIVGVFNISPAQNTQRVRVTFASADTDPAVTSVLPSNPYTLKAGVAYAHSLKRWDTGNELVLSDGTFTFRQATET